MGSPPVVLPLRPGPVGGLREPTTVPGLRVKWLGVCRCVSSQEESPQLP